jgi:hypothetical protein
VQLVIDAPPAVAAGDAGDQLLRLVLANGMDAAAGAGREFTDA